MKKILLFILILGSYINVLAMDGDSNNVSCFCQFEDNLCDISCNAEDLFTICVNKFDCTTITTKIIDDNHTYNSFEIHNREIYLNNSNILSLKFDNVWTSLNYKIHITGTNKIRNLISVNAGKYSELAKNYPQIYTSDFIPFSVEGDGTLEIEQAQNILKVDSDGNVYYNYWYYNPPYDVSDEYRNVSRNNILANRECLYDVLDGGYGLSCQPPLYMPLTKNDVVEAFINESSNPRFISDIYSTEMQATSYPKTLQNVGDLLALNNYPLAVKPCSVECEREQVINQILDQNIIVGIFPEYEIGQISRAWGEANIQTDLTRSYNDNGHYVIGANIEEELETITTTQTGNIVFTSSESFDSNYHLKVEDVTEHITDIDASKVEAKTDKTLIKLYDINMLDKDNKVVDMGNGTYTIKVALSDLLKKYNEYQVVYINENGVELLPAKVEEGYIVFNTTHLSKYGIVGLERTTKKDIITGEDITNPKTADTIVTYSLILTSLAVSIALVVLRIKKLKEN